MLVEGLQRDFEYANTIILVVDGKTTKPQMKTGMYDALYNFFATFGQHWMKKLVFVVTDWSSPLDCQESDEFAQDCQNKVWFQQEFITQFYYKHFTNVKQIHDDLPFVFFEALDDGDILQQRWEKSANQLWQYVSQHERMHFRLIDSVFEENSRFKREMEGFKSLSDKMTLMEQKMKEMEENMVNELSSKVSKVFVDNKIQDIEKKFNSEIEKLNEGVSSNNEMLKAVKDKFNSNFENLSTKVSSQNLSHERKIENAEKKFNSEIKKLTEGVTSNNEMIKAVKDKFNSNFENLTTKVSSQNLSHERKIQNTEKKFDSEIQKLTKGVSSNDKMIKDVKEKCNADFNSLSTKVSSNGNVRHKVEELIEKFDILSSNVSLIINKEEEGKFLILLFPPSFNN